MKTLKSRKAKLCIVLTLLSFCVGAQNNTVELISASTGSEGDLQYYDVSVINIDADGTVIPEGDSALFDWLSSSVLNLDNALNKSFGLRIQAMGSTNVNVGSQYGALLTQAGIDRDNSGLIGVRGNTNGIDSNEGITVGLDLTNLNSQIVFLLKAIKVKYVNDSETGTIVNRNNTILEKTFGATGTGADVELSEGTVDVSSLGITLRGRQKDNELAAVFNTATSGNFRIEGFVFEVSVEVLNAAVVQNDTLDMLSASTGSEGDNIFYDISGIEISSSGQASVSGSSGYYDWNVSGVFDQGETLGKSFDLRIDAMGTTNISLGANYGALLTTAGIDRDNSGLIGVRGNTNGIDANEGIRAGLDLTNFSTSVFFQLIAVKLKYVNDVETGEIVNRNNTAQKLSFGASGTGADVEISSGTIDVSTLDITLQGGQTDDDLVSIFNTAGSGNFRVEGLVFSVMVSDPTGSFNYSAMAAHPRLLLSSSEEQTLLQAVNQSDNFKNVHDYIISECDSILTYSDIVYELEGKRLLNKSREALLHIFYLSYGYRMTGNTQYLTKAETDLNTVCNFSDWNPSHYLDVGEMCMAVAIGYDWLYDDLSDATKRNIRDAIVTNAFKTSSGQSFLTATNNWNQVCNTGLVYGALAIYENEKTASAAIIEQAMESNPLALNEYGPDGNYVEGAMYWVYGTSFQVMMLAAFESALGTDNGLSQTEGFLESAQYMMYMSGPTQLRFNYSDCTRQQSPKPATFWFADKTDNPSLLFEEAKLMTLGLYKTSEDRLLPTALIYGYNFDLDNLSEPLAKLWKGNGDTPVVLARTGWDSTNEKYLGIKGGKASTSHSHMDAGTFVFDDNRYRWAMDFGLQTYYEVESAGVNLWDMSQNSERWDVFRLNNMNHNTMSINDQRHKVSGKAEFTEYYETSTKLGAKINLTNALNLNSELQEATREIYIENEENLKIIDVIETNGSSVDLYWNMVTPALTELVNDSTIRLSQGDKKMLLRFSSQTAFTLDANRSTTPDNSYESSNDGTVMVGFDATIPANTRATFYVTLEEEAQTPPTLIENYIYLDNHIPSIAREGYTLYSDESIIKIDSTGNAYMLGYADDYGWLAYGDVTIEDVFNQQFVFRYDGIGSADTTIGANYGALLAKSGIDRASNDMLGIRGGETYGIDANEGLRLGLDLSRLPSTIDVQLVEVGFYYVNGSETGIIVNRNNTSKSVTFGAAGTGADIELSSGFVDVEELDIIVSGGDTDEDLASVFNACASGNFRINGFRLKLIDSTAMKSTMLDVNNIDKLNNWGKVYPNPFNTQLNVEAENRKSSSFNVKILDMCGNCLIEATEKQFDENSKVTLDLSELVCGMYICCINDGEKVHCIKIIKR